jgi:hypothetical protein
MYFSLTYLSLNKMTLFMEVAVDGLIATSNQFTLEMGGDDSICGTVLIQDEDILTAKNLIQIDTDLMRNYTFKVLNSNGEVITSPQPVLLDSVFISSSLTEFPKGVFNNFKSQTKLTSIVEGIATFQDYSLKKGTKGHIYLRGMTYSILPAGNKKLASLVSTNVLT